MSTGKYIRRTVGYFVKLLVLVVVLYLLLFVTGSAKVSAELFVRELVTTPRGLILLVALAVLSAFYPRFGYVSRKIDGVSLDGDREMIINAFHSAGYVMASEEQGRRMSFRASSLLRRLWLTFDDAVTVTAEEDGILLEGIRKETVHAQFRINTYLQNRR